MKRNRHTLAALLTAVLAATAICSTAAVGIALEQDITVDEDAPIVPDPHGLTSELREEIGPHAVWVADRMFRHSILFDGDTGDALGMLDITWSLGGVTPHTSLERGEFYVVEPTYARGQRGKRTDFVTIYDAKTLSVVDEIALASLSAEAGHGVALSALLDDGRFLVILNQTPANSVSIVNVEERRYVGDIQTAGCSLVYPVGPRRFGMLCGNGTAVAIDLNDDGSGADLQRSEPFFDTLEDPLIAKGARDGSRWMFASFDGYLHEVDFGNGIPKLVGRWSLLSDSERDATWRVGGNQCLALHVGKRRLYALVHKGGPGSHKDAGSEVWVYDVETKKRIETIDVPSLLPAFLRPVLGIEAGSFTDSLMYMLLPNLGAHSIVVTQDDEPLMFVRHGEVGAIAVLDAVSGDHVRDIEESGPTGGTMRVP